jgi:hypothetical protein
MTESSPSLDGRGLRREPFGSELRAELLSRTFGGWVNSQIFDATGSTPSLTLPRQGGGNN